MVSHAAPKLDVPLSNNRALIPTRVGGPLADLGVEVLPATLMVVAGETAHYSLVVTNHGPCPAQGVCLTDSTPGATPASGAFTAFCPGAGALPGVLLGTLAPGPAPAVDVAREIPCDRPTGPLGGVASVSSSPATSDLIPKNNSAPIPIQIVVRADYAIEKSGPTSAAAGSLVEYSIAVTNLGPSCPSSLVSDSFPPELLNPRWCRGEGCTPQLPGDLVDRIGLLPQGTETYRVTAAVSSLCTGSFPNTATVETPAGFDSHPENDASAVETGCLPAPGCVDCPIPTLSDAGLIVFALLLALVPLLFLRGRPSL